MTPERYRELLAAGPEITAEDWGRLRTFTPKLKPMAKAVNLAIQEIEWTAHTKKRKAP